MPFHEDGPSVEPTRCAIVVDQALPASGAYDTALPPHDGRAPGIYRAAFV